MTPIESYGGDTGVSEEEMQERNDFYRTSRQNINIAPGVTLDAARDSTFNQPTGTFTPTQPLGRASMSDAAALLQSGVKTPTPEGQTEGPNPASRYGYAIALVDTNSYGEKRVFENLLRLEATEGVLFRTYIKEETHKDPEKAARDMPLPKWMMQYTGESPTFRFDKDNKLAKLYQVKDKDYPVMIYQDPGGERRYFSIASSIESFRKKYDQVRKEVDAKR
ncbi:MAG: hypothetical protein GC134_07320 [Proteobacteria bacterium]|nr:hypothetical protein [Pseudomonadota bacterium]